MKADEIDSDFGPSMRLLRMEANMSQEELSSRLAELGLTLSQAIIGKIERSERKVTIGEATTIAKALDSDLDTLLWGKDHLTENLLQQQLLVLRRELLQSFSNYESAQFIAAMEADGLGAYSEFIEETVLESLEDVLKEYRRNKIAQNAEREHRDSLDSADENYEPKISPKALEALDNDDISLFGKWRKFHGNDSEQIPQPHAWTVLKQAHKRKPHNLAQPDG